MNTWLERDALLAAASELECAYRKTKGVQSYLKTLRSNGPIELGSSEAKKGGYVGVA